MQLNRSVLILNIGIKTNNRTALNVFLQRVKVGDDTVDFFAHLAAQISNDIAIKRFLFLKSLVVRIQSFKQA